MFAATEVHVPAGVAGTVYLYHHAAVCPAIVSVFVVAVGDEPAVSVAAALNVSDANSFSLVQVALLYAL